MKLLTFILLNIICSTLTFAQCDVLDSDGSGFIQADEMVFHLGNYGTSDSQSDFNEDGVVGVEDVFTLLPYIGMSCPIDGWLPESTGHIQGIVLQEFHSHEVDIQGTSTLISVGSTTYRVYVELSNVNDDLIGVYGTNNYPLYLTTDTEFYFDEFTQDIPATTSSVNPLMIPFYPAAEYSTYLAVNSMPEDDDLGIMILNESLGGYWMGGPTHMEISSEIGGGWFDGLLDYSPEPSSSPNLQLIGQFTVIGTSEFSGTVNVQARTTELSVHDHIEIATGLTFSSSNVSVFGCTDTEAVNFNPEAEYSDDSCWANGDINGNGEVSVDDLLLLLQYYGCYDCPDYDLNGDGVINVFDILDFLLVI